MEDEMRSELKRKARLIFGRRHEEKTLQGAVLLAVFHITRHICIDRNPRC